jgi:hypothetical protein
MATTSKSKKISTLEHIETLGLPERQRNQAVANLAVADNLVRAIFSATKLLHLR